MSSPSLTLHLCYTDAGRSDNTYAILHAEQLNSLLLAKNQQIAERSATAHADRAALDALTKQSAAVDVDLIRIRQRIARLQKTADRGADPKRQPRMNAASTAGRDQQMSKHLKLELLQRCTGLILDGSAEQGGGVSGLVIGVDDLELRPFAIAKGTAAERMEQQLWTLMAESCGPGLADMERLFGEAKIVD